MKKALALALLLLLASTAFAQIPDWWFHGSLNEAFAKAKTENKLVLLDFNSFT
ncbi:MAG: hypothetical protein PHI34_13295 [Acidobacteriota bacterium]|nr:hypothetical protein [Acidobacteriota bacterium]